MKWLVITIFLLNSIRQLFSMSQTQRTRFYHKTQVVFFTLSFWFGIPQPLEESAEQFSSKRRDLRFEPAKLRMTFGIIFVILSFLVFYFNQSSSGRYHLKHYTYYGLTMIAAFLWIPYFALRPGNVSNLLWVIIQIQLGILNAISQSEPPARCLDRFHDLSD